jgi:hypothetical protein
VLVREVGEEEEGVEKGEGKEEPYAKWRIRSSKSNFGVAVGESTVWM